jgi:hypothetical protein
MSTFMKLILSVFLLAAAPLFAANTPRVFLLNPNQLAVTRAKIQSGDNTFSAALAELKREADDALNAGPFSVMFKNAVPPGGDKHDYLSQAPYFWPNPDTWNGLPYVRHDGKRNPEINKISDHRSIGKIGNVTETLALNFYFTGDEACAEKAAKLIRAWFLDPATRMNPNFQFAQGVPGISTGRSYGLIESRGLTRVVDAAGLLAGSKSWTTADQRGLEDWFSKFLQWMRESKLGRKESANKNNHGTYYDVQAVSFALFLGKTDLAKEILETAKSKRIALQIQPDGRQPLELARTNAWGYSIQNLTGLMDLADLGERVGVDLWNFQTADGRGIRKALEYLAPFALDGKKWPYTSRPSSPSFFSVARRAALHYNDAAFQKFFPKIPAARQNDRANLLTPKVSNLKTKPPE